MLLFTFSQWGCLKKDLKVIHSWLQTSCNGFLTLTTFQPTIIYYEYIQGAGREYCLHAKASFRGGVLMNAPFIEVSFCSVGKRMIRLA